MHPSRSLSLAALVLWGCHPAPAAEPAAPVAVVVPAASAPEPPPAAEGPPAVPGLQWLPVAPGLQMTRSEATVGQYRACVKAGACSDRLVHGMEWPGRFEFEPRAECTYPSGGDDLPMNCVAYEDARGFCAFAGGRLPTAREWRRAASNDGRTAWPWGQGPDPSCATAVLGLDGDWCGAAPTPVCSRPSGHNQAGICDLVGSLYEWTARPESPSEEWVMVGECFNNFAASGSLDEMQLGVDSPLYRTHPLGIRCVRDEP